ncbi:hypothetical protein J1N35_045700 [Gossypium stocksii]|uniref:Uncharacterized protein n=1 Tax=Gossypium stocksii TaxID=47602 RepID=A0A9D3UBR8_9ROSI|nr:hypothetical protein J1N35_045700 [Gossypium stocksii]
MARSDRRIKRVTDPLDNRVKARLIGISYYSSESKHSAAVVVEDDDSPCLSELVHSFLEDDHDAAEQRVTTLTQIESTQTLTLPIRWRSSLSQPLLTTRMLTGICLWLTPQCGDMQDQMELLWRPNCRKLRVHRHGAICSTLGPKPGFHGKKRGIENDRQGHERFGKKIVEEQRTNPLCMKEKPLYAKQMVRFIPSNDEPNLGKLQLIDPVGSKAFFFW